MSALDGEVQIPKLGGVKKKTLVFIAVPFAAFIGWRYWQARGAADYEETAEDTGFEDAGTLPAVDGAYKNDNSYGFGGSSGTDSGSVDDYGFHGTTNAQWSQYAATQLVASDVWSYTDIITALGKYLNKQPLSQTEQQIVQAAIAVAGYPPVGSFAIIPVTTTPVALPAPSGLKASSVTKSSCTLTWNSVAGASKYVVRRDGTQFETSSDTKSTPTGLTANTSYAFSVAAVGLDGKEGSASSLTVKTLADTTTLPADPNTPQPKPTTNKYPKRRLNYKAKRGDNYTKIANQYKTGLSGTELYNYQFTKEAGRSAQAKAVLKERGPNLIYSGTTVAVPYPK